MREGGEAGNDFEPAPAAVAEHQPAAPLIFLGEERAQGMVVVLAAERAAEPVARPPGAAAIAAQEPTLLEPARLSQRRTGTTHRTAAVRLARLAKLGSGPIRPVSQLVQEGQAKGREGIIGLNINLLEGGQNTRRSAVGLAWRCSRNCRHRGVCISRPTRRRPGISPAWTPSWPEGAGHGGPLAMERSRSMQ